MISHPLQVIQRGALFSCATCASVGCSLSRFERFDWRYVGFVNGIICSVKGVVNIVVIGFWKWALFLVVLVGGTWMIY